MSYYAILLEKAEEKDFVAGRWKHHPTFAFEFKIKHKVHHTLVQIVDSARVNVSDNLYV